MGAFYTIGEQKIRPGSFIRYENTGTSPEAAIPSGTAAAVFKATWGPLGEAMDIATPTDREKYYGAAGANSNSDIIDIELKAAAKVKAIRLGTGGTKATYAIKDTAGTPATVINATAKYAGTRALTLTIKDSLTDATKREFIVYEGTKELQKLIFTKGGAGEVDALIAAWTAAGSDWVDLAKATTGTGLLAAITQQAMTGGADPTITNADYSSAFTVIEALDWNSIAVDSNDSAVNTLLAEYVNRVFTEGKLVRGTAGEPASVALATRQTNAAAFNNFCMHYCLNGYYEGTTKYEGWKAAARVAGIIAAAAANASLTHFVISGATALTETLTNPQIETSLQKGCLVFTTNPLGQVQIEYGINTLISLTANQDAGWKKIRRVSTRFELMKRITGVTDPLIEKVDNSPDGRATLISAAQGIINKMASEGKLLPGGTIIEDPDNPPAGDSAWFKIGVDDLDSGEKLYFAFGFRFAPEA